MLVNYWWRPVPAYMDTPINALMLAHADACATCRRSSASTWQDVFRHYVFEADDGHRRAYPAHARGVLAPLDANTAAQVRSVLRKRLER